MAYTFLEHTANIRMQVAAKSLKVLFQEALLGMVKFMDPTQLQEKLNIKREITIEATDATALLIDFLNEALAWMHSKQEAYTNAQFQLLTEHTLIAI